MAAGRVECSKKWGGKKVKTPHSFKKKKKKKGNLPKSVSTQNYDLFIKLPNMFACTTKKIKA